MRLYIAEKPSMAAEIAKNLPGTATRKNGYYEVGQDRVTWLYGHILQQAPPEKYDEKYRYWKAEDLPIVPSEWKLLIAGADPATSVVDEWNRAHDVANLYVVDGSCFVTSGGVNPTSTICALALRAADRMVATRHEQAVP